MCFVGAAMSMAWASTAHANHDDYFAGDGTITIDDTWGAPTAGSTQWTSPSPSDYGEWPSWADGRYADSPQSFCAASDIAVWDDWGQVYNCAPTYGGQRFY